MSDRLFSQALDRHERMCDRINDQIGRLVDELNSLSTDAGQSTSLTSDLIERLDRIRRDFNQGIVALLPEHIDFDL